MKQVTVYDMAQPFTRVAYRTPGPRISLSAFPFQVPFICMDVANGYSEFFVNAVRRMRERHPSTTIIAGNVVTGEMVEELVLSGADIVKVHSTGRKPYSSPLAEFH
jgi:hypothetical protein